MGKTLEYIKSDLYRYSGHTNFKAFCKSYIKIPAFRWQVAFRCRQVGSGGVRLFGDFLWALNHNRKWIVVHPSCKIGYGLYIGHNGPLVINDSTVIGNNCNLSQFVSIGSNFGHAAIIGDNVYIGPNVCIVENVAIGDNATIGAGAVVTKDIPSNATAVGNYAKVISYNNPGQFIGNKWSQTK